MHAKMEQAIHNDSGQTPGSHWGRIRRALAAGFAEIEPYLRRCADFILPPMGWLLCKALGFLTWHFTSRRNATLRNLPLAFPGKPWGWHDKIARQSVQRMFEMFLVPLITPWLSEGEISRRFRMPPATRAVLGNNPEGLVILTPHMTLVESGTFIFKLAPEMPPPIVLYRPLDFGPADRYVRWARSRWGVRPHSRRDGLIAARDALSRKQSVAILFDQNAQWVGALVLSFGRVCSATDLPGMLAAKLHKPVVLIYPRRTGFLRCEMDVPDFDPGDNAATITARSTKRLEDEMRRKDSACADWLWAHQRWKLRDSFGDKLNLNAKKNYLAESMRAYGLDALPRRTPFCIRLPAETDAARMAVPLLPRLRQARPDVFWTVIAPSDISHELREGEHYDRLEPFNDPSRLPHVLSGLRSQWIDTYFCLRPDANAARERRLCNARKVFGISTRIQRDRKGVALWLAPENLLESDRFADLATAFLKACGLPDNASAAAGDARATPAASAASEDEVAG
jgi:lauroyl/myristoyl acyltransferase